MVTSNGLWTVGASNREGEVAFGSRRICDHVRFSPFTYCGLYGEVAALSNDASVRFCVTRPSKITGHLMESWRVKRGVAFARASVMNN